MKKVFFKTMMGAGVAGMLMAGCVESVKDLYDPNYVIEQYQKNWEEQFGEIDPDHTWNMAKQVVADINLYGIADDECEVKIYTANPISSECSLLAKGLVQGNKVVSFDVPSPLQYVFVTATNSRGALVNGYYKIEEGVVTIGKSVTRAEETRVGNIGLTYSKEFSYWDPNASRSVSGEVQFAHLSNVEITTGETWMINDFVDVVGNNGVFSEYGVGVNGKVQSNLDKWKDVLGTEVIYKLTSNGPLNLSYNFGATQNDYLFGYFYYEDNENPNDAVRYVLLSSTDPCNYLKINGGAMPSNMYLGNIENLSVDTKVTGSKISLTYFDSNNNASYIFPENLNVGFFIAKKDSEGKVDWNHMKHSSNEISCNPYNFSTPKFVTYNVGSTTFLGVEDGTDDDMNDLLFFVSGNFSKPQVIVPDVNPTAKEWIFACEDLGSVGDFDFNDIVFKVAYASGETTAKVTPLAAGGVLEANIKFGSQTIGEIHELLGGSVGSMINTGLGTTGSGNSVDVQVGEGYSISNNFGGFSLQIVKEDGTTTVDITAPGQGEAPQMICVDAPWAWPKEKVSIVKAYSGFGEWGANYENNNWVSTKNSEYVCE